MRARDTNSSGALERKPVPGAVPVHPVLREGRSGSGGLSYWETLYACDFFGVVLSAFGTARYMVFFVMQVKTRAVKLAGVRIDPDGEWMKQNRDPVFTEAWTRLLETNGVTCVPIPAQSPNCSPHAERFVKTIRSECLDHFVIFSERHLRHLIREFSEHYLTERYRQGIGSRIIMPSPSNDDGALGAIGCRSRLGGVLN